MVPVKDRIIKVTFNAHVHASLQWNFRPQQTEIYVVPGQTALAFHKTKNPTDKPVMGISTYNVVPFEAGQYFNKIQCFCFDEQRLNPQEEVDMPVFFYIDPEFAEDSRMVNVDLITLSYTFFFFLKQRRGINCQSQTIIQITKSCFKFVIFEKSCPLSSQRSIYSNVKPSVLNVMYWWFFSSQLIYPT